MKEKEVIGYKIMTMENNELISLASKEVRFPAEVNQIFSMGGKGIWLSTNPDFVKDYYSNPDVENEVLLKLSFKKADVTSGNLEDREPVITVPTAKIIEIHRIIDGDLVEYKTKNKEVVKNTSKKRPKL